MPADHDPARGLDQELAAGQDEKTPVIALGTVVLAVAALFLVALALAALAYVLA